MEKVKAICIKNIIREHPLDDYTEVPFTIGKVYELSVAGDSKWCWAVHDLERIGHYPMNLFKTLDEVRNEHLDIILG
jgi:hypothetical protein